MARLADSAAAPTRSRLSSTPKVPSVCVDFPGRYNLRRSRKHGQAHARLLELCKDMSLSLFVRKAVICTTLAAAFPGLLSADSSYTTNGGQYAIAGALPGDQVHPRIAINSSGGLLVWEDNRTDGAGLGISAQRLDSGLSGKLSSFQVNQIAVGDQERPQVSLLKDGGAAFAWQSGQLGSQHIYTRFLASDNTWRTGDILVSDATKEMQVNPVITTLTGGNVIVVYTSLNQYSATSMKDVYGQVFSPLGEKLGGEFLVNQFTAYNQRTPAVAALANGGFVIAWVSEQQRVAVGNSNPGTVYAGYSAPSVDIYARTYSASGVPVGNEILVNAPTFACANPVVAASDDGSFAVAWAEKDTKVLANGWDIFTRRFSNVGVGSAVRRANTQIRRDQIDPQISASGSDYFLVWNTLGTNGTKQGVSGQFLSSDGSLSGTEFPVDSAAATKQVHPALATDGEGRFLVAWTSFISISAGYDILAQRYINTSQPISRMDAPFVHMPYEPEQRSLPAPGSGAHGRFRLASLSITMRFTPMALQPRPQRSRPISGPPSGSCGPPLIRSPFAYVTTDGHVPPFHPRQVPPPGPDYNWSGIPFEWMTANYGSDFSLWPGANSELAPGGLTLAQVFITGGNPKDSIRGCAPGSKPPRMD